MKFFEATFLCHELTHAKNIDFIKQAIDHLEGLEEEEIYSWEMIPDSEKYFRSRPIGGERPFPTSSLAIDTGGFIKELSTFNFRQNDQAEFVTDVVFKDYRNIIKNAACLSDLCYAIFLYSRNKRIEYLWFDKVEDATDESKHNTSKMLYHLGNSFEMVLVDWYEKEIINLNSLEEIEKFL